MVFGSKTVVLTLALAALLIPASSQQQVPGTGFSSALELTSGTYSFYLAVGETHFFKINLDPGDILVVKVRMAFNQDFDLYLLNPLREIVAQSVRAAGFTDSIELIAAEKGPHYMVVTGFGVTQGTYSLTVFVQKPRTVTQTVTTTVTQRLTETATALSFMTNTVVSEKLVTVVDREVVEVERIPWTAVGLAVLAASVLYLGYAASNTLKNMGRREEKQTPPPASEPSKTE
ncbi:MAG: hypothetical protein RMI43_03115 [Candidatus Caldarchaeum sp.]|nr:hypothetical protein [Candidatus Caldarchaeum sp.]MCX8200791.1 hypothetical protein [Candidatus Caldarchaeum sp.]MDW8063141.1 hypothetical protein [Candidatus Caldarchaeum sp.]MDW8434672.1 hypothetical protein [Candidatus Caldarchaeum sp.]